MQPSVISHNESGVLTPALFHRVDTSYRKTYAFEGDFIDDFQRSLACLRLNERGKTEFPFNFSNCLPAPEFRRVIVDLVKLYELAFFSTGNVIDLGTAHGRSSFVMSKALIASGNRNSVHTIELSAKQNAIALQNLKAFPHCSNVIFYQGSGHVVLKELLRQGSSADFVFVDHCHEFEEAALTCALLDLIIPTSGMALFHDYYDSRNFDPDNLEYNVVKGIEAGLDFTRFEPLGIFGSTGLFRRYR